VELHDVPGDASEQQTFDALRAAGLDPGDRLKPGSQVKVVVE